MKNADKPAYPVDSRANEMIDQGHWWEAGCGLTKRERIAIAAMQGILANKFSRSSVRKALDENGFMSEMKDVATVISEEAVIYADALLKELREETA